jgi:putative endonuclease
MVAQAQKITTQDIGRRGEQTAADFFRAQGYTVLARNWKCRGGELDLVIRKGDDLRVIEVKARLGPHRGPLGPHEAVTDRKLARIGTAIGLFFAAHPELPPEAHIDVLAILFHPQGEPEIQWLKDFE